MKTYKYPLKPEWEDILRRPVKDMTSLFSTVEEILTDIKQRGDTALRKYTTKFDKVEISSFEVSENEIEEAVKIVSPQLKSAIDLAADNIQKFHESQLINHKTIETQPGVCCWQKSVPVEKIGLYIPGGNAPLFSTVLMLAIPAKIAGCREIVLCTPPGKDGNINPVILYAAYLTGVTRIFKLGGIQAIGAMAYGTESVPKVYKILGPGNQYVTAAKQIVSRNDAAIDMPAGPSEVAVMADETANPAFVASDLLSQAEHGVDSQVILVTNHEKLIAEVQKELNIQLNDLSKKHIALRSLENSRVILLKETQDMIDLINAYAPEHLIISMENADKISDQIINAGSVFIGNYTPESAGDYASGTNHTLPTNGHAKAYNGINLDSFLKKITFQKITTEGLKNIGPAIELMADAEELSAHRNAVSIRLKSLSKK